MKIIVVGCGRIGAALALRLSAAGHTTTVIDPDRQAFDRLGEDFRGRTIDGIGFDRETLLRAGIEHADAVAAVTSDDSSNVIIARIARNRFKVPRVVARLFDPCHADLYQVLGIPTASTVAWGVDRLEQILCYTSLEGILSIGNGAVEIIQTRVPTALAGQPVQSLQIPGEAIVVALTRDGLTSLPRPEMLLQAGDLLHVSIVRGSLGYLQDRLGHAEEEPV